ncbi:DNA cytosine methyltransferase [Sediminibacterium roseum]|uniref:Cytosine-specific methyltransferase n=1 Tax=Sediminibacterium roseum TaxID=1978412 RepID=A0ABW9ZPM6_9BACT|nr:DNA cytosine methyltransferase [Sediminibacterium roseum]NCI48480.1 DNA cytosine methyltransferase [Sediminibacterium roseum]
MDRKLKHIELFAGCGGMSLGLEAAGFELVLANELSPMAGETFAYNLLDENLRELASKGSSSNKVLWLRSQFTQLELTERLRENPFDYSKGNRTDIDDKTVFDNNLIVGNINDFLDVLSSKPKLLAQLRKQDVDLLSGGPPCQSFSLAGRREKDNHKNLLPLSFAKFAGMIKPKVVLLENVKGITSPFTLDGHKYHAWVEVAKAFSLEQFVPICFMLNSKFYGVPQNRPRFILMALRKDVLQALLTKTNDPLSKSILENADRFYKLVQKYKLNLDVITHKDLELYDINKLPQVFNGELMPAIETNKNNFISAEEAIGDLESNVVDEASMPAYVMVLNKLFAKKGKKSNKLVNHITRRHNFQVRARFRWLQLVTTLNGTAPEALKALLGNLDKTTAEIVFEKIKKTKILTHQGEKEALKRLASFPEFLDYLKSIQTKKHSQRALKANEPAPAQMTIPDDLCHYSENELRTLTVREMARFQSFPDWFEFRSKVTTGGKQRSFEIPQYTQVGNAVPPLLALRLGQVIHNIINKIEND